MCTSRGIQVKGDLNGASRGSQEKTKGDNLCIYCPHMVDVKNCTMYYSVI